MTVDAVSEIDAITTGGKLEFKLKPSDKFKIFAGLDVFNIARDGERTRLVKLNMMGMPLPTPMEFKDKVILEGEQDGTEDSSTMEEFVIREVKSLMHPRLLEGFGKILPKISSFNHNEFSCLENLYTFDDAINFGQNWFESLRDVQGFRQRWKSLREMIEKPIRKLRKKPEWHKRMHKMLRFIREDIRLSICVRNHT